MTAGADAARLALLGEGAIAGIHLDALKGTGARVTHLVAGDAEAGAAFARDHGIGTVCALEEALGAVDGVVVASPSDLHAEQARLAMAADLPVLIEIPMATTLADCEALAAAPGQAMVAHTRRFSPAHRAMKARLEAGEVLHHLVAETYFMRRENLNMLGQPRSWVDSLIWHHAVHSVDLFIWLTGDPDPSVIAQAGPPHPDLGCAMDLTIGLRAASGAVMTLACSFNNEGPFGGFYRYVCEGGTWHAFRDELRDANRDPVAVDGPGAFAAQDARFVAALRGADAPWPTPADALPAMRIVAAIAARLGTG